MLTPATILTKHPDVACRTVDGHAIAIRSPRLHETPALVTFNETGTVIWDLLDGRTSVQVLLAQLAARYPETPADRRETETLALLEQLLAGGMVVSHHEVAP